MTQDPAPPPHPLRTNSLLGVLAVGALLAVTIGACGGKGPASNTTATTSPTTSGTGTGSRFPGATGEVAAINGNSMEVQNQQTGQVTVSWTSSTVFTKTVSVAGSSIVAGDCITATGSTASGTLVATSVTISQPDSSGSCNRALGPGGGGFGSRFQRGSTPPSSIPNRTLPAGAANFAFASGKVTSVSPTSLVVLGFSSSGFGRRGTTGTTPPTSVPATDVTVDVNPSTRYTQTQPADAAALAVNDCVSAVGPSDDTGAITAKTVRITPMGPNGCSTGLGREAIAGNG